MSEVTKCTVRKDLCGSVCIGLRFEMVMRSIGHLVSFTVDFNWYWVKTKTKQNKIPSNDRKCNLICFVSWKRPLINKEYILKTRKLHFQNCQFWKKKSKFTYKKCCGLYGLCIGIFEKQYFRYTNNVNYGICTSKRKTTKK